MPISLPSDPIQLIRRRAETEAHLAALLKQSGSGATVEQFTKFVYEKGSVISLGDFVAVAICQFPTRRRDVDFATRLAVLTDALELLFAPGARRKVPDRLLAELQNK